jgi:ComF family protein
MRTLRAAAGALLEALAPRRCAGCDAVAGEALCAACTAALIELPAPPVRPLGHGQAHAAWEFAGVVRTAIHRGKYGGDREALRVLTRLAWPRLEPRLGAAAPGVLVPVPAGRRRRAQRGYNQAEVIAVELAAASGHALLRSLVRTRETAPQASRDEAARQANVDGAFAWQGPSLEGRALRLIDDVCTTGATARAAATALAAAGARPVDVIVLATVL